MDKKLKKTKEKNWIIKSDNSAHATEAAEKLSAGLGINPIIAKLLYNRGYTEIASAKSFLRMETEILSNPYLFADMQKAIERIEKAIREKEKITVYGDYDVDGVTAVCTLYLYLKSKGADVEYYIPNRTGEGYGVSFNAVSALAEGGTKLIVTVDTGITADEEVEFAKSVGVDFVITDHHECRQTLPSAVAVVNPHRQDCKSTFKELAGVGVVFKLICAHAAFSEGRELSLVTFDILKRYSELIAIGTIADVMQIKDENRIIVSSGLKLMENTSNVGIAALVDAASNKVDSPRNSQKKKHVKITSGYIGYTLAPRINAAGRIRSASMAVELFLADDYDKAYEIAEQLCQANRERQDEENKIMKEAYKKIEEFSYGNMPVIVLDSDDWHHGVIGIVSSRITEKYGRPSILVSFEGNEAPSPTPDDIGKGSGRSIKGMNLVDALCYCSDELIKFGGHELAAGLSVTRGNLDAFRKKINEYALLKLSDEDMVPTIEADLEISLSDITLDLAEEIRILEPFGVGNPVPTFVIRSATVNELSSVSDGKHTRIAMSSGKNVVFGMCFSMPMSSMNFSVGDKVDILFNVDINEWGGRKSVQLIVRDIKESEESLAGIRREQEHFARIWAGERFSADEAILPDRNDFAIVYRMIVSSLRCGVDNMSHKDMIHKLAQSKTKINYVKLKIIIKVMQELNLMGIEEYEEENYKFYEYKKNGKTELEKSHLLRKIRSQQNG